MRAHKHLILLARQKDEVALNGERLCDRNHIHMLAILTHNIEVASTALVTPHTRLREAEGRGDPEYVHKPLDCFVAKPPRKDVFCVEGVRGYQRYD